MSPYLNRRLHAAPAAGPVTGLAAQIRQEIVTRRQGLAEYDEVGGIDTTARVLAVLHETFVGRISSVSFDRTPREMRKRLAGEHGLPLEDLVHLAMAEPEAMRPVVAVLLTAMGLAEPVWAGATPSARPVGLEMADVVDAFATVAGQWSRDLADGRLDQPDLLLKLVNNLIDEAVDLRSAIARAADELARGGAR